MEYDIQALIEANFESLVEPCELTVGIGGLEKHLSIFCRYNLKNPDDTEDLIQAVIDICSREVASHGTHKYIVKVQFTNKAKSLFFEIIKEEKQLKITKYDGNVRTVNKYSLTE